MGLIDELWEHSRTHHKPRLKPRLGFVDAGIVLIEPLIFKREEFKSLSDEELDDISEIIDRFTNVDFEEDLETQEFFIFDEIPCITSLGA